MMTQNGQHFLEWELDWLAKVVTTRLENHFKIKQEQKEVDAIPPPDIEQVRCSYAQFARSNNLNFEERVILILSLVPFIKPNFLDDLISGVLKNPGEFPQIGGVRGKAFRGILPTVETALFILAGDDLNRRFHVQSYFNQDHLFFTKQIIHLEDGFDSEPSMSNRIVLDDEYVELFTVGEVSKPKLSTSFPAQLITTEMEWGDLVLNSATLDQINEIEIWIKYNNTLMNEWGMKKKIKPGYRCLFHGPPGTGKTLTACLLGKYTGRDVFRVDLSTVVSKFIGETEKNLSVLFDKAESKDWILFFDEADALFGKRTNIRDAHDKYANQEVSYLLQRVESHSGLVILASNYKSNIDEAFTRRFQSLVHFPMPKSDERLTLWKQSLPANINLAGDINLEEIARQYELSGANIINIVQYVSLQALSKGHDHIDNLLLQEGIKKEYIKEGKVI